MRSSEGFVFVRPGLHLYYHVLGDGEEAVVVPNANWLAELLQPLAAEGSRRRLILYDPRSRGRSSAVTDGRHLSLEEDVADLSAAARFPLDDVCSFPNEWPQHVMSLYFRHIIPKIKGWDFRPRLESLRRPLLVMQGTDDLVPEEASREWAAHAGDGRFLRIEGSGHHPYIERPQEFFPAADAFLAGGWPPGAELVPRPA